MAKLKLSKSNPGFLIILLLLTAGLLVSPEWFTRIVAAQSTGDTLPTRTPTPRSSATPVPPPSLVPAIIPNTWVGRLVSNTLGVTEGNGSIFRVSVEGQVGTRIELRSGGYVLFGESGSKPEYGSYTAEFAPVSKGLWVVSVPSLGVSLPVEADGYNLAVIDFGRIPVAEATQTALPLPTATPLSGQIWQGSLVIASARRKRSPSSLRSSILSFPGQTSFRPVSPGSRTPRRWSGRRVQSAGLRRGAATRRVALDWLSLRSK